MSIRKKIIKDFFNSPKMNREMLDSDGYKALLDVVEVLQPGAKDQFIKYNEMKGGSVH